MTEESFTIPRPDREIELSIPRPEQKRVSNPFKQGAAGVIDLATEIPGMLGLAGAGLESIADYALDDNDKTFGQTFLDAMSEGIDADFLSASDVGRRWTNKLFDIEDPKSTEDQIARNLALFVPIPIMGLAKGASRAAKLARGAMHVTLPTVKPGSKASVAARGAMQGSFGLGIDQGVRALIDDPKNLPLLLSDVALSGGVEDTQTAEGRDFFPDPSGAPDFPQAANYGSLSVSQPTSFSIPRPSQNLTISRPNIDVNIATQDQLDTDAKLEKENDFDDVRNVAIIVAGIFGGGYAARKHIKKFADLPKPRKDFDSAKHFHETVMDRGKVNDHVFEQMGVDEIDRAAADNTVHVDINGVAREATVEGKYGQGFDNEKWKSYSANVLDTDEVNLGQTGKRVTFNNAMKAQSELSAVRKGKREPSMWRKNISDKELEDMVALGRNDEDILKLMDKHAQNFRADLEYEVHRGAITKGDRDDLLDTFGDITKDGQVGTYMPFYGKTKLDYIKLLGRKYLGVNTKKGDELETVAEFYARSGGTATEIMNPGDAAKRHRLHNTAYVNEQLYKNDVLSKMAGIAAHATSEGYTRLALKNGKFVHSAKAMDHADTGRGTYLVGVGHDIKTNPNAIHINIAKGDDALKGLKDQSINDLKVLPGMGKNIVTVQHKGKLFVYNVPDQGVRAAMEINPRLGRILEFNNHWKNVFQKFTTGEFSLFAPISHAFSAQQVASTTVGRARKAAAARGETLSMAGAVKEGAKSFGRSLGGSRDMFMDQAAGILASYLARSIATGKGFGQGQHALQRTLHNRYSNSLLHKVRSETGRTTTSWGTTETTLQEMLDGFGGVIPEKYTDQLAKFYGVEEMGFIKNIWKAYNNAANEGPAFGVIQREIGKHVQMGHTPTPKEIAAIRKAVEAGKTHAGDMSRRGANPFVQGINATIPFSSATLQSWNALGSAAKADWKAFSVGVGALIGVPTLTELTMNAALSQTGVTFTDMGGGIDPETGQVKEWTYDDYYWNGYTTQQRVDNMIIFIPGRAPWEAAIIPISPEWGLFRSVVMEGADAVFNLSQVGANEVAGGIRNHILHSLHRVLDIPLPPVLAAGLSLSGVDIRAGANIKTGEDPDAPATELSFLEALPIGTGERITSRMGRTKDVNGFHDKTTAAMIKDLFGAGGTAYVALADALYAGTTNVGGGIVQGLSEGVDAVIDSGRRQARYLQPLPLIGGKTFKTGDPEIAARLHGKRAALRSLLADAKVLEGAQGYVRIEGKDVPIDNVIPTGDPIRIQLAGDAKVVDSNIRMLDKTIAKLRADITRVRHATTLGSHRERQDIIDGKNSEIQAYKAQQLAAFNTFQDIWSRELTKKYRRDITVDLSGGPGTTIERRD